MDDMTKYIFAYHGHLMTPQEIAANRVIYGREKTQGLTDSGALTKFYQKQFGSTDPEVLALVEKGHEKFIADVVERILWEQREQVVFNYCPKCQTLARTPTARQCPKCFYSWHDEAA